MHLVIPNKKCSSEAIPFYSSSFHLFMKITKKYNLLIFRIGTLFINSFKLIFKKRNLKTKEKI